MKNSAYWQERFKLLEQSQNQRGMQCYADIEKQYRQAQKQLEGQIAAWYQRFASNNGVTIAEAKRMLNAKELAELKWDVNQYIQYGQENAINGAWVKQLENASARFHISRLEGLKLQTQQSLEVMFGNQLDSIDGTMRDVYKSGYYHTAYEIQKGVGVGWDFSTLDEKRISKVINKPWAVDGKNFSERIWGNRQKLVNELNTELTRNIILGQDPQKAIDAIAKKMNTSKNVAGRLVMTEEAFFNSAAQKDCFAELDVEQFEIVATLDSHTSEICRGMDGKHFPMTQWEVGITAPPFHVYCRSTTVPFFDDEFDRVGERAARGEDGKTYYVPADMTYREWEKSFVDGDKTGLQEVSVDDIIGHMEITKVWIETQGKKGSVTEKLSYMVNGIAYVADGTHVILKPSEHERKVAEILSQKYGKTVELVPQIVYPQGIQTPDYLIDGERFDLKSPTGSGKNLIYGLIAKKRKQAGNFVIDISGCPLDEEEIGRQIENLYMSPRLGFLEKVVLMKHEKILKCIAESKKESFIEPVNHSRNGTRGSRTTLSLTIIYHSFRKNTILFMKHKGWK